MLAWTLRPAYRTALQADLPEQAAGLALGRHLPEDAQVGILLAGDGEVQRLNREYRGMDRTTDVLSFEQNVPDPESGLLYVGDIVISVPQARKQARADGVELKQELELLVVHGILHLAGYDHGTAREERCMWELQAALLSELGNPLAGLFQKAGRNV